MGKRDIKKSEELGEELGIDPIIHHEWFKFTDHMKKWYWKEYPEYISKNGSLVESGKKLKEFDSSKMIGYDAMKRVKKYSENPENNIKILSVDDSTHSGSMIVLVPHPFMGVTVIFIPQCTNNQGEFFLYPNALLELVDELMKTNRYINSDDINE